MDIEDEVIEEEHVRVQQVISRAETLVEQLDDTVGDLVRLLRSYAAKTEGSENA